jgi:predicted porin
MNKKLLTAAIAAVIAAPTAALANDVTVYGVAHLSVDYLDQGNRGWDGWDVASRASRLGFMGTEDLANGLKAIWKMEFQIDMADAGGVAAANVQDVPAQVPGLLGSPTIATGSAAGTPVNQKDDLVSARNMYVGLAGGWGTALVGRHDTPYKMSTGKLDLFADTLADYNSTLYFTDIRTGSSFAGALVTPHTTGCTVTNSQVLLNACNNPNATLLGNKATNDADGAEAFSAAASYNNAGFFASVAYEWISENWLNAYTGIGNNAIQGSDDEKWRFGLGWTGMGFTVGGLYETQSNLYGLTNVDKDSWQLSAGYTFGNNMVKGMYGQANFNTAATGVGLNDVDSWAIGLDHNFSKRTKAYLLYTSVDGNGAPADVNDRSGFSLGMIHSF